MLQLFRPNRHPLPPLKCMAALRYAFRGWRMPGSKPPPKKILRHPARRDNNFRQLSFTFAVIALSAKLACAGGPLTKEKYLAFRAAFPLKGGVCNKIRSLFMLACENDTPLDHYVTQIKYAYPKQPALFAALVDRLFSIAAAGGVSREEERLLSQIAHQLGLSAAEYAEIHARRARPPQAHEVLGVHRRIHRHALKKRYHELLQRWHPDRFGGDELSPEVALMLQLKTTEITQAYRALSRKAA